MIKSQIMGLYIIDTASRDAPSAQKQAAPPCKKASLAASRPVEIDKTRDVQWGKAHCGFQD